MENNSKTTQIKLSPKDSCMHLDASCLTLNLPDISFIIQEEQKPQKTPITILKRKEKSGSKELF